MIAVKTENLTKKYKDKTVVDSLNLEINHGELFGLLGVNGAGKTTTIKMLTGLLLKNGGEAYLDGHPIDTEIDEIKKISNVSPQETAVAPNLTVKENLEFIAGIYCMENPKAQAAEMIELFNMTEVEEQKAKTLSGGWQRRLSIAMALISNPSILFLDEPTLGLDVLARHELWNIIDALKGKVTIILTTHYLEEAEQLCDRIAIMSKGKLMALGTAEELKKLAGEDNFEDAFIEIAQEGTV